MKDYNRQQVLDRDGNICWLCQQIIDLELKAPHPRSFTIDHIVPLDKGGRNIFKNVSPAHLICNNSKSNKMPCEWLTKHQGVVSRGAVTALLLVFDTDEELMTVLNKLKHSRNKKLKEQIIEIQKYINTE